MISIEKVDGCTTFSVAGEVTANEIILHFIQAMENQATGTAVWDFRQVTKANITTLEMKGLADLTKTDELLQLAVLAAAPIDAGEHRLLRLTLRLAIDA